jgi:hypothetical protein
MTELRPVVNKENDKSEGKLAIEILASKASTRERRNTRVTYEQKSYIRKEEK